MKIANVELFFKKGGGDFVWFKLKNFCIYILKINVGSKIWRNMLSSVSIEKHLRLISSESPIE